MLAHNVMAQYINGASTFDLNLSKNFNSHLRLFKAAPWISCYGSFPYRWFLWWNKQILSPLRDFLIPDPNMPSTITSLPNELLCIIFLNAIEDSLPKMEKYWATEYPELLPFDAHHDHNPPTLWKAPLNPIVGVSENSLTSPVTLSQVCKRWQKVARAFPSLWASEYNWPSDFFENAWLGDHQKFPMCYFSTSNKPVRFVHWPVHWPAWPTELYIENRS